MWPERILITGANGLLGQELVQQLARRTSCQILATGRAPSSSMPKSQDFLYQQLDVCDTEQIHEVFKNFSPEYLINCAAVTGVDDCEIHREICWRVNADAVGNLARICYHQGIRLLQISTDFVFDGREGPYREHDRPHPVNFYGKSKLAGENATRAAGGGKWTIVRTNVLYGTAVKTKRLDFVQWVIDHLSRKEPIHVFTDQWRTPSYTYDLVKGILQLVHFQKAGVYNLSGREFISMYEFAQSIAQVFDLDHTLILPTVQHATPQKAPRPGYTGLVILKAETELHYRPLPLKEALKHLQFRTPTADAQH